MEKQKREATLSALRATLSAPACTAACTCCICRRCSSRACVLMLKLQFWGFMSFNSLTYTADTQLTRQHLMMSPAASGVLALLCERLYLFFYTYFYMFFLYIILLYILFSCCERLVTSYCQRPCSALSAPRMLTHADVCASYADECSVSASFADVYALTSCCPCPCSALSAPPPLRSRAPWQQQRRYLYFCTSNASKLST